MEPTTGLQPQARFQGFGRLCRPSRSQLIFFECELAHTSRLIFELFCLAWADGAPIGEMSVVPQASIGAASLGDKPCHGFLPSCRVPLPVV
jgi:hypothetical protein